MENLFAKVLVKSLFPQNNGVQVAGGQAFKMSYLLSWCSFNSIIILIPTMQLLSNKWCIQTAPYD